MPAGSQASRAVRQFRQWLQDTLYCITEAHLAASADWLKPSAPGSQPHTVSFAFPVPLDGPARVALSVDHHYRIKRAAGSGRWKITTAAYYYAFDAQDGGEILAYHWHPGDDNISFPHLHLSRGAVDAGLLAAAQRSPQANALRPEVAGAHLPTGRIALEDVVYIAITQFGVPAKRARWEETLRASRVEFARMRTWHEWPPLFPAPLATE